MMVNDDSLSGERTRQLVPSASVEDAAIHLLVDSTPLLKEEGNTGIGALITNTAHPIRVERPCSGARFSPGNCPVDAL